MVPVQNIVSNSVVFDYLFYFPPEQNLQSPLIPILSLSLALALAGTPVKQCGQIEEEGHDANAT